MLGSMSAIAEDPVEPNASAVPRPGRRLIDRQHGLGVCPFLRSRDGSWSSAFVSRDLRCWAVQPTAQPSAQKQRQLCLAAAHATCSTFETADSVDPFLGRADAGDAALWPAAASIPIALESVHTRPDVNVASPRAGGQALLVGLMVVAFLVLAIARTNQLAGVGASPSPDATATAAASAIVGVPASATASPVPSVADSASPAAPSATIAPSPTPAPTATQRSYKVRSGDTIASIAAKFHTTVTAIVGANKIVDPRTIHPGQILVIP
jgi:LysM repeat protein